MTPKKAVHHLLNAFKPGISFILLFLGELGSRLICKFYLLLGQQIAEGFHALFQLTFNLLLEVTKICPRVNSSLVVGDLFRSGACLGEDSCGNFTSNSSPHFTTRDFC